MVLVGEIHQQKTQGLWYLRVQREYSYLFPEWRHLTRYRVRCNFERSYADSLLIAQPNGVDLIDSKPLPSKGVRYGRDRAMSQARSGRGGASRKFVGYKLRAIGNTWGAICRFGIVSHEHGSTVARALRDEQQDDFSAIIGDKAYGSLGIYTPPS